MDIVSIAKKIRAAVMDRAENDGRVFHGDAIEDEVAKILKAEFPTTNVWGYGVAMGAAHGISQCMDVDRVVYPPVFVVRLNQCESIDLGPGGTEWR